MPTSSKFSLQKTYTMASNPPPAWGWDAYSAWVAENYGKLLSSKESEHETNVQRFFEAHPCLVPGLSHFNKVPYPGALISQPRLTGVGTTIPDFLWIGFDSATVYLYLIEIETPHRRWYGPNDRPHAEFSAAYDQLMQWKQWLGNSANQQVLLAMYNIPSDLLAFRRVVHHCFLVHGSGSEFSRRLHLNARRAEYNKEDISVMTFDRLSPRHDAWNLWCVKHKEDGFHALEVPPTFKMGPGVARDVSLFKDRQEAIRKNSLLDAARKDFLVSRLAYWDEWVKADVGGLRGADWE